MHYNVQKMLSIVKTANKSNVRLNGYK